MNSKFRQNVTKILQKNINRDTYNNIASLIIQESMDLGKMLSIVQKEVEEYSKKKNLNQNETDNIMENIQDVLSWMITNSMIKSIQR
jgi:hypothetical protein